MNRNVIRFSDHAVERFIERFAQGMSVGQARAWLEQEGPQATRLRTRTALGQEQWELQNPKCILVVKNSEDAGRMCKTILFSKPENFGGFTEEEMEIIREAAERMPPIKPDYVEPGYVPKVPPPPKPSKAAPSVAALAKTLPKASNKVVATELQKQAVEVQKEITQRYRVVESAKTQRHIATMEKNLSTQKKCLRAALRYLLSKAAEGDPLAMEIAEDIQEIEPGFVTEAFMFPRKTG